MEPGHHSIRNAPHPTFETDAAVERIVLIYNPRSGRNARDPRILARARQFAETATCDCTLKFTEAPLHATQLAREAVHAGAQRVVAIGGDGTLNEVATALVGTTVALGLVPCGSGNGLGRHLGIPGPGRGAFRTLLHGRIREIDTGEVQGVPFFNAMGLGFDAELSAHFNRLTKRGFSAYVRTTLRLLRSYQPETYTIADGAGERTVRAFLLAVANSNQYGNDCYIAPHARIDDGLLDLTALPPIRASNIVPLVYRLFRGTVDRGSEVLTRQASEFYIRRGRAGPFHTDGEVHEGPAELRISLKPRSLRILVPSPK